MSVPGTTIELSSEGAKKVRESLRNQCGACSVCFLCLLVPLALATGVFFFVLAIAFIAFSIQALVVGSNTINDPALANCIFIPQWLIVFGSLMVAGTGLELINACVRSRLKEKPNLSLALWFYFPRFISIVTFGWVCCGLAVTYNPGSYPTCSPSTYRVFHDMVNFLFWGTIALIVATFVLACMMAPVFMMFRKHDKKNEEKTAEEQQNLLEKA